MPCSSLVAAREHENQLVGKGSWNGCGRPAFAPLYVLDSVATARGRRGLVAARVHAARWDHPPARPQSSRSRPLAHAHACPRLRFGPSTCLFRPARLPRHLLVVAHCATHGPRARTTSMHTLVADQFHGVPAAYASPRNAGPALQPCRAIPRNRGFRNGRKPWLHDDGQARPWEGLQQSTANQCKRWRSRRAQWCAT